MKQTHRNATVTSKGVQTPRQGCCNPDVWTQHTCWLAHSIRASRCGPMTSFITCSSSAAARRPAAQYPTYAIQPLCNCRMVMPEKACRACILGKTKRRLDAAASLINANVTSTTEGQVSLEELSAATQRIAGSFFE